MINLPVLDHCELVSSVCLCTVKACCLTFAYISIGNIKPQYQCSSPTEVSDSGVGQVTAVN